MRNADIIKLNEIVDANESRLKELHENDKKKYFEMIDKLVKSSPVFLFIKVFYRGFTKF